MGTAFNLAKTSPASWDAFSDVDAFVDAVLAELAAMAADGTRRPRSGPKPTLTRLSREWGSSAVTLPHQAGPGGKFSGERGVAALHELQAN